MTKAEGQIQGDALYCLELFFPWIPMIDEIQTEECLLTFAEDGHESLRTSWFLGRFLLYLFFFLVFLCLLDNCIFYCVFLRCFENKLIILSPFDLKPSEFCSCMYSDLSESNSAVHFSYCLCLCMPELFLHFFSWVEIWWVSVVPIWIMKLSYSKAFCHTAIPLLGSEHQLTLWLIRHVDYCWCSLCKSFIGIFNKAS